MKRFRIVLISGWSGLAGSLCLLVLAPRSLKPILAPFAVYIVLVPTVLLILTVVYKIAHLYRAGMAAQKTLVKGGDPK
jgi:hypothetical protein